MAKKQWYTMRAIAEGEKTVAEIRIYDEIGFWGMTAKDFVTELDAVAKDATEIVVSINSPGGDVFDAFAIYNALRRYSGKVTARVDGVAASAASLVLMAGDTVLMPENAMIMIHDAWTIAAGTAKELRSTADMMDKVGDGIIAAYVGKSNKSKDEIVAMMDETTWMTALEAQALGFCDLIEEPVKLAASANMTAILAKFEGIPEAFLATLEADEPSAIDDPKAAAITSAKNAAVSIAAATSAKNTAAATVPDPKVESVAAVTLAAHIYAACRAAGLPNMAEAVLMTGGLDSTEAADARVAEAKEVAGLCLAAKLPEKAADFIKAGLNVEQVRARLFDIVVTDAAGSISNLQRPEKAVQNEGGPTVGESIYAARAARRQINHRH